MIEIECESKERKKNEEEELVRNPDLEIIKTTEDHFIIMLNDHIYFEPEGPYELKIVYKGFFEFVDEDMNDLEEKSQFIKDNLKEIGVILSPFSISLAADLIEKFGYMPLIIPPWKGFDREGE
ncbi:MAG: hypothetical protein ACOCZR_00670 [Halanaerobiales bacterium]